MIGYEPHAGSWICYAVNEEDYSSCLSRGRSGSHAGLWLWHGVLWAKLGGSCFGLRDQASCFLPPEMLTHKHLAASY